MIAFIEHVTLASNPFQARQVQSLPEDSGLQQGGILGQISGEKQIIWIPLQLCQTVFRLYQEHFLRGHLGYFKTLKRIQQRYIWLGMRSDVSQ